MWNLKCNRNELIYETKTDSDIESRLVVASGEEEREGWEGLRALGQQVKLYRVDEQQGATLKHKTVFSIF